MPIRAWSLVLSTLLAAGLTPAQDLESVRAICDTFRGFDFDGDGEAEIVSLQLHSLHTEGKPLLVLLEKRLEDLRPALSTYLDDLAKEGWAPFLVVAEVYAGERHQDGLTLLALRELLRKLHAWKGELAGAVLVGSFPEASLVRQYNWRKGEPLKLGEREWKEPVAYLRSMPEPVAHRCELILCDLDGNWEKLYRRERQNVPYVIGVLPERGYVCRDFQRGTQAFEDYFFVNDGVYEANETPDGGLNFVPRDDLQDSECSAEDRTRPNPLARPEILVSRIDARGVALQPKAQLLAERKPTAAELEGEAWEPDLELERRLLIEYFERNHRYRSGAYCEQFQPAAIAHGLGSGFAGARSAVESWSAYDEPGSHFEGNPSLLDFVTWLKHPAVLRDLRAHSGPHYSAFEKVDAKALEEACGIPWSWKREGKQLVPSLEGVAKSGHAGFALLRTLYENRALPEGASFYFHTGCEAISPPHWHDRPYNHPHYAWMQGAESLLFYGNGLALVGRAKVFYDAPRGFYEALRDGSTLGEAWARYFDIESRASSLGEVGGGIGRKRSYFWSVIGDWTLCLR